MTEIKKEGLPVFDNPPKPPRKTPVPQSADRIQAGALKLDLKARVALEKILHESNQNEVNRLNEQLKEAQELLNGK